MAKIAAQIVSTDSTFFVDINLCKRVGKDACREMYTLTNGKNFCLDFEQQFPRFMDINLCKRVKKDKCNQKYICWQIKNCCSDFERKFPPFCGYKLMQATEKRWMGPKNICGQMKKIAAPILSSNSPCFVDINLCKRVEKDTCGHKKYMWANGKNYCSNFEQRFHLFCGY